MNMTVKGKLYLVPAPLDFGCDVHAPLQELATKAPRRAWLIDCRAALLRPDNIDAGTGRVTRYVQSSFGAGECSVFQRVCGEFVQNHGQCGRGAFSNRHPRYGNADATAEGAHVVVRGQQD